MARLWDNFPIWVIVWFRLLEHMASKALSIDCPRCIYIFIASSFFPPVVPFVRCICVRWFFPSHLCTESILSFIRIGFSASTKFVERLNTEHQIIYWMINVMLYDKQEQNSTNLNKNYFAAFCCINPTFIWDFWTFSCRVPKERKERKGKKPDIFVFFCTSFGSCDFVCYAVTDSSFGFCLL